jgi:hypothetical protein
MPGVAEGLRPLRFSLSTTVRTDIPERTKRTIGFRITEAAVIRISQLTQADFGMSRPISSAS